MTQDEFESLVATLEQENRQLRARNDRLQFENDALNLELGNPIDHEEWGKHQKPLEAYMFGILEGRGSQAFEADMVKPQTNTCKHDVDDGACKECYEESARKRKEIK